MNQRFKELEKQAWEFVDKTWNWADANNPSKATLFKTKFAELIVRECICIVINGKYDEEKFDPTDDFHRGHNRALDFAEEGINNHFGVKE